MPFIVISLSIDTLFLITFLIIISFSLFRPDFWLDKYQVPFFEMPGIKIYELLKDKNNILISDKKQSVRVEFQGPDFDNPEKRSENCGSFVFNMLGPKG